MRGNTGEDVNAKVDALIAQDSGRQRRAGAVSARPKLRRKRR